MCLFEKHTRGTLTVNNSSLFNDYMMNLENRGIIHSSQAQLNSALIVEMQEKSHHTVPA